MNKIFTSKTIFAVFALIGLVIISLPSTTNTGGAPPGYTNAPLNSTTRENNCTGCHAGSLQTSGTNFNNITLTNNFVGAGYVPDSTYTITLNYTHTGKSKFGYQLTCLDNNFLMAGSFATISGNNKSSVISNATRSYMRQTSTGSAGSGSAAWSFRWTAPSTNLDTLTIYAVVNSANSAGGNSGDIIIAREFKIAPSSLLPTATAATTNASPCAGQSFSLQGSSTNTATSWAWSIPGAVPSSSSSQNPTVSYTNPGSYNAVLRSTNALGESVPDTVVINVNAAPSAFITGGDRVICEGDSTELFVGFEPGVNYVWNNGPKGNSQWVTDTGSYLVNAVGASGCERRSNVINVSYYPKPTTTLSSNASAFNDSSCFGATIHLQAGSALFDSFAYYKNGLLLAITAQDTLSDMLTATTDYGLRVKNSNGCWSDTITYTVSGIARTAAPIVDCQLSTPTTLEFSWMSAAAHSGYQVSVDGGLWRNPSSGPNGTTHLVTGLFPDDSVTLSVRAIDNSLCVYSEVASKKCYTQPCTQLAATISAPAAVCLGDLWDIEINGLAGASYSLSLDGGATFTDTLISFNPTLSKEYTLSITDSNNLVCPVAEYVLPVRVDRIADIDLKTNKLGAYCPGEEIEISANDSIDNFDFIANNQVVKSSGENNFSSTTLMNGDSVYVIVTKGECIDTSELIFINREVDASASFTESRMQTIYTFTPDRQNYTSYTWDFGDGSPLSNDVIATNDYVASEGQTVNVSLGIVTTNNCAYDSTRSIDLPQFSNIEVLTQLGIRVYPNPTEEMVYIENKENKPMEIRINTLSGETVLATTLTGSRLDISTLSAGIYMINVAIDGQEASLRLLKK